jgi:crooked neck
LQQKIVHISKFVITGDIERSRGIYELAINQPRLDMPEILWKSYIDFEIEQEETDRARELYRRLLSKTQHVKVWLSLAKFELSLTHDSNVIQARHIYEEANKSLRDSSENNPEAKEHRVMLLEAW